jgi:hypothetical protein
MTSPFARAALGALCVLAAFPQAQAQSGGIPDFSGKWGRNAFDFEPPPSGPPPVRNIKRLPSGVGDPQALIGDDQNPILRPEAAAIVRRRGEISRSGNAFPDPSNQCTPWAPPFVFSMQLGLQILQQKDRITILYNQDDQTRHIPLNGSHPVKLTPSWKGHSVAHYEGDTLVIDTVGFKVGPDSTVDRYGTPHSEKLHVIERYRLIDGDAAKQASELHQKNEGRAGLGGAVIVDPEYKGPGLQLSFTVEDEKMFTTPWSAVVTYRRNRGTWLEQVCAENPNEYYDQKVTAIPTDATPDF